MPRIESLIKSLVKSLVVIIGVVPARGREVVLVVGIVSPCEGVVLHKVHCDIIISDKLAGDYGLHWMIKYDRA